LFTTDSKYPENNNFVLVTEENQQSSKNMDNQKLKIENFENVNLTSIKQNQFQTINR
jgi:hypothetical protein